MGMVVPSNCTTTFSPNHDLGNDSQNVVFHKIAPVVTEPTRGPSHMDPIEQHPHKVKYYQHYRFKNSKLLVQYDKMNHT